MKLNRAPSVKELAAAMDVSEADIILYQQLGQDLVSLDTPVGEDEDSTLANFIPDAEAESPADAVIGKLMREELLEALDTLSARENAVIQLRFGLTDGTTHTLEDVGSAFNVTRERIRQIEAKALRKLRRSKSLQALAG